MAAKNNLTLTSNTSQAQATDHKNTLESFDDVAERFGSRIDQPKPLLGNKDSRDDKVVKSWDSELK